MIVLDACQPALRPGLTLQDTGRSVAAQVIVVDTIETTGIDAEKRQ